ncbi:MAG: cytochrome P450 [Hyphomicrobiaceae bacterium]
MSVQESAVSAPLYPPAITPPDDPQKPIEFLLTFVRNPLLTLPKGAYQRPVLVHRPTSRVKVAWICDPAVIEDMLVDKHGRFKKNLVEERVLGPILGNGVLIADGAAWRWQRRAIAPLMRAGDIGTYVPAMVQASHELLDRWRKSSNGTSQRVDKEMVDLTFAIIARTMLTGGEPAEADMIKREGEQFISHTSWEIAYTLLRLPRWLPHPDKWRTRRAARRVRKAVLSIVRRRRKMSEHSDDLLGRLLRAEDPETGQTMNDEQVVDNLVTLLAAGHETTAKALTWTLYLLARAPDWQQRARDEIRNVVGDGPVTTGHLDQLTVIDRVLKESMRLYPPVIVIARTPTKRLELLGEYFNPGDQLTIPIWCLHRHEQLWDDPDRFDPDRFLPEFDKDRPRTQFMPFGAGARICIGMSFAQVEAKVILATLLRHASFEWDGAYVPEPVSRVTLRPRDGMPLKVHMLD